MLLFSVPVAPTWSMVMCVDRVSDHPTDRTSSTQSCQSHLAGNQETRVRNGPWLTSITSSIQGSFTCRKSTTWDLRLYFPSEGGGGPDFYHP
jgi:hypothetical protein